MPMSRCLVLLTGLTGLSFVMPAQQPANPWQGEWGQFTPVAGSNPAAYQGEALRIDACSAPTCAASVLIQSQAGRGGGDGTLRIESATKAVLELRSAGRYRCSVTLERSTAISMTAADPGCANFLIPGQTFQHELAFRSATVFYGFDVAACFFGDGAATRALCANEQLSQLRERWRTTRGDAWETASKRPDVEAEDRALTARCDSAADPETCLSTAYRGGIEQTQHANTAWLEQRTAPGSAAEAAARINAIAGSYRHTFQNGDVQGETFSSTDTLEIARASATDIHYKLNLEFYNGHQCSREGTASYKQSGSFVDQTKVDSAANNSKEELCVFELIPTAQGVELRDATGMCRNTDCGARGGYNNTAFTSAEKAGPSR